MLDIYLANANIVVMQTFKDYWKSLTPKQKQALADESGIKYSYLSSVAGGNRNASFVTAQKLELADPAINLDMFRQDVVMEESQPLPAGKKTPKPEKPSHV